MPACRRIAKISALYQLNACVQGEGPHLAAKASANAAPVAKQVKLSEQHIKSQSIIIASDLLLFKTYILSYTISSQQSMY